MKNEFEMGFGNPTKKVPKENNNTKQEQNFDDLKKDLQLIENNELSSMEAKKTLASRLKKAVCSITAGMLLFCATPAFAQDNDSQLTEQQNIELEEPESDIYNTKIKELGGYLDHFNIEGLKLGKVQRPLRCACDQFGLYLHGKHLGDVYANSGMALTKHKLIEGASNVLRNNGILSENGISKPQKNEAIKTKVSISPEAKKLLQSWGGFINLQSSTIDIGSQEELVFDKDTKKIEIMDAGKDTLIIYCENFDGKVTHVICVNKKVQEIIEIK
jgi:hypothetical protein